MGAYEIDKECLVRAGLFLVRFQNVHDQIEVTRKGFHYFDQKPFLVKPWDEEMEINTEEITSLPIWVQFRGLDIKFWDADSLSKIDNMIGIPLKMDKYTSKKTMLRYARFLIDIPLGIHFLTMWNLQMIMMSL